MHATLSGLASGTNAAHLTAAVWTPATLDTAFSPRQRALVQLLPRSAHSCRRYARRRL